MMCNSTCHFLYAAINYKIFAIFLVQYIDPLQPNGIFIDFIDIDVANVTYNNDANDIFVNYTVTMEIVPASCDHVIPIMTVHTDADPEGNYGYIMCQLHLLITWQPYK